VIADKASTDATLAVARGLAADHDRVEVVHLDAKGRALRRGAAALSRHRRGTWVFARCDPAGALTVIPRW
jgi:hypothetical protein